jgi:hypothetical protein
MRNAICSLLLGFAFAVQAYANPSLTGTWSAAVNGQPLTVVFEGNGTGKVNGKPMRWQTLGTMLVVEQDGTVSSYQYQAERGKLSVTGQDLGGTVVFVPGTIKKASAPASGNAQELVGKWCLLSTFRANSGGSSRMTCFELKPDGTYTYQHEGSMSASAPGMWGGTASQSSDAGRWKFAGNQLTAQSQRGTVNTYTVEKRNHPKNKRDPMICLDGECYVTFYNKAPW